MQVNRRTVSCYSTNRYFTKGDNMEYGDMVELLHMYFGIGAKVFSKSQSRIGLWRIRSLSFGVYFLHLRRFTASTILLLNHD